MRLRLPKLGGLPVGVMLGLMLALVAECGVRLWSTVADDWRQNWAEPGFAFSRELGWRLQPGFVGQTDYGFRRLHSSGYLEADAAQLDNPNKILVVADSTGFGNGVPTEATYAEVLERSLGNAAVFNLSVPGYSSEQGKRVVRDKLPRLHPKVVIVSFNFNDRRVSLAADGSEQFERLYRARRSRRIHSHVVDAIVDAIPSLAARRTQPANVRIADAHPRVELDAYRKNLTEIAQLGRAAGARVIFLLLSDNPESQRWVRSGYAHLQAGELKAALDDFERSRAIEGMYSGLSRKYVAEALRRLDPIDHAKHEMILGLVNSLHGDSLLYFDTDYSAVMRSVAEQEGVVVVDGAAVLNADTSVYNDLCHFGVVGHSRIAAALRGPVAAALTGVAP